MNIILLYLKNNFKNTILRESQQSEISMIFYKGRITGYN